MEKIFLAEYCFSQKMFHIGTLEGLIKDNKSIVEEIIKTENDDKNLKRGYYIPFKIGTYDECSSAIDEIIKLRNK